MSDRDEFDEYDFSEFTNQDLQEIDAHLARKHSPFNTFLSSKKYFTVTDLVSPTWYARLVSTPPLPSHLFPGAKYSTNIASMENATNPSTYALPPSPQRQENTYASINRSLTQMTADSSVARHACSIQTIPYLSSSRPVCPQGSRKRTASREIRRPRYLRRGTLRSSVSHLLPSTPLAHPL